MHSCTRATDIADPDPLRRQAMALLPLLAATALLAGCGSSPRTGSRQARRPAPAPTGGQLRTRYPQLAASRPVLLDPRLREAAVASALMTVNTPYRYGGNTPEGGFDCSGLVQYVFNSIGGQRLPRSTRQWAEGSTPLDLSRLQRGDLLFFNTRVPRSRTWASISATTSSCTRRPPAARCAPTASTTAISHRVLTAHAACSSAPETGQILRRNRNLPLGS